MKLEKQAKLLALKLGDDEIGRKIGDNKDDQVWSYIDWAQRVRILADEIGDSNGLLISIIHNNLPLARTSNAFTCTMAHHFQYPNTIHASSSGCKHTTLHPLTICLSLKCRQHPHHNSDACYTLHDQQRWLHGTSSASHRQEHAIPEDQ